MRCPKIGLIMGFSAAWVVWLGAAWDVRAQSVAVAEPQVEDVPIGTNCNRANSDLTLGSGTLGNPSHNPERDDGRLPVPPPEDFVCNPNPSACGVHQYCDPEWCICRQAPSSGEKEKPPGEDDPPPDTDPTTEPNRPEPECVQDSDCDDGNFCTGDYCVRGVCLNEEESVERCGLSSHCTERSCHSLLGCQQRPIFIPQCVGDVPAWHRPPELGDPSRIQAFVRAGIEVYFDMDNNGELEWQDWLVDWDEAGLFIPLNDGDADKNAEPDHKQPRPVPESRFVDLKITFGECHAPNGFYSLSYDETQVHVFGESWEPIRNEEPGPPLVFYQPCGAEDSSIVLKVMGLETSEKLGDVQIGVHPFYFDDEGFPSQPTSWLSWWVHATVIRADVDVDSDNSGTVELDEAEDLFEDVGAGYTTWSRFKPTGKAFAVNLDDDNVVDLDSDGVDEYGNLIPDFADGFDLTDYLHWAKHENDLIPLIVEVPEPIEIDKASIRFTYNEFDPRTVKPTDPPRTDPWATRQYTLNQNPLVAEFVLWLHGPQNHAGGFRPRNKVAFEHGGMWIRSGEVYGFADLATREAPSPNPRRWEFALEGIYASNELGEDDTRIVFEIDPDGPEGPADFVSSDAVRLTPVRIAYQEQERWEAAQPDGHHSLYADTLIPNPAMVAIGDEAKFQAEFRSWNDIRPAAYRGLDNGRVRWVVVDSTGDATFEENMGSDFHVVGSRQGLVEFRPQVDGILLDSPVIRTVVAPKLYLDVRLNVVTLVSTWYSAPGVPDFTEGDELLQIFDEMNIWLRQAAIEVRRENAVIEDNPSIETIETFETIEPGIFSFTIAAKEFPPGTLPRYHRSVSENRSPDDSVLNLHYVKFFSGINALGVSLYKPDSNLSLPIGGSLFVENDWLKLRSLHYSSSRLSSPFAVVRCFDFDGEDADETEHAKHKTAYLMAHELLHVLGLEHASASGSPIIDQDGVRKNVILDGYYGNYPEAWDMHLRQAQIIRQSIYLKAE